MKIALKKVWSTMAVSISICLSFNVKSEDYDSARALQNEGFQYAGKGIWQRVNEDGVTQRVGSGPESELLLMDSLSRREHELKSSMASSHDILQSLMLSSSIAQIKEQITILKEHQESGELNLKSSGNFGCSWASLSSASVSVPARSASASAGVTGWSRPERVARLGMAYAYSQSQPDDLDVRGTMGSPNSGYMSVSASSPGTGACELYSYAHVFNITTGCGNWSDAYYVCP